MFKSFILTLAIFLIALDSYSQDTKLRFFSHPGFEYLHHLDSSTGNPYFRGGPFVIYATSQIGENVSMGGEVNLHYMTNTGPEIELERIFLKYYYNDYISLRVGRLYTPINYWNLNYNFGLILQPTINRPMPMNPTHDGGFTLNRDAGLQIEGENIGSARFNYKFFVSNGVGKNGGVMGSNERMGRSNCYTAQVGAEPADGLKVFLSGQYHKQLEGALNQYDNPVPEDIDFYTGSVSLVHMSSEKKFEFIGEYMNTNHKYKTLGHHGIHSAILYAGFKVTDKFIPYFIHESTNFDFEHIYFPTENVHTQRPFNSVRNYDLGFRYILNPNIVFKFESGLQFEDRYGMLLNLKTQLAFAF
ncbi:MAG: hypothetical protein SNJ77_03295 [Cytophagales bacterium]